MLNFFKKIFITLFISLTLSLPALAVDSTRFFNFLQKEYALQNWRIEGTVSHDNNQITVERVSFNFSNDPKSSPIIITNLKFEGIKESSEDSYQVDKVSFSSYFNQLNKKSDQELSLKVENGELHDVKIAAKTTDKDLNFSNMSAQDVTLNNNNEFIRVQNLLVIVPDFEKNQKIVSSIKMDKIFIDLTNNIFQNKTEKLIKLGYKQITGKLSYNSQGDLSTGHVDLALNIQGTNIGQLQVNGKLEGLTKDFINQLLQLDRSYLNSNENENVANLAVLGLVQQIKLKNLFLRFDDASLTNKLIDASKGDDISHEDFVTQISAIAQFGLATLQNPKFSQNASQEITKFLKDPKNITISAQPQEPVLMAIIGATALASPKKLLDILDISLKANQ